MKVGYLRVSTKDQCEDRQIDALRPICDELHVEKLSALAPVRPVYEAVIARLKPGDTFVILDLDRAYRSAKDALNELDRLHARGIDIQIANLNVDTATPFGKVIYTIISALAEFERAMLTFEPGREGRDRVARDNRVHHAQRHQGFGRVYPIRSGQSARSDR